MNPLQEHPRLFANGKFKVRLQKGEIKILRGVFRILDGNYTLYLSNQINKETVQVLKAKSHRATNCTLIARPISDMTDEEIEQIWPDSKLSIPSLKRQFFGRDKQRNQMIYAANDDKLLFDEVRHLLSIGVYPFDQSHFESGIVIDSTTL